MADITLKYLTELPAASKVDNGDLLHLNQGGVDKSVTAGAFINALVAAILPVGSVIFRATNENPNTLYPGTTWTRLPSAMNIRTAKEDGSDLLRTEGSDNVRLISDNIPSHSHAYSGTVTAAGDHNHGTACSVAGNHIHRSWTDAQGQHGHNAWTDAQGNHNHGVGIRNPANYGGSGGYYGIRGVGLGSGAWAQGGGQTGSESVTSTDGNHSHNVGIGASGQHSHNVGMDGAGDHQHIITIGTAGNHTHSYSGTTNATGGGTAFSIIPASYKLAGWRRTE